MGGLTLDILSYGSVCDWLGFMIPGGRYYSLFNISDSFVPRKPPVEDIENFENESVFYAIRNKSIFENKSLLIAGGGDSALDWTNELSKKSNV